MEIINDLFEQNIEYEEIANLAIENNNILNELIYAISPENKKSEIRYKSHQVLIIIAKLNPKILYQFWDLFVELIQSKNAFHNMNGVYIISGIIEADFENRFDEIFDSYFNLLYNKKVAVGSHTALNSPKIAKAKPQYISAIVNKLLEYEEKGKDVKQKELVKAYIIDAFNDLFLISTKQNEILEFVKAQINSESPKAKKAAKQFIEKHK